MDIILFPLHCNTAHRRRQAPFSPPSITPCRRAEYYSSEVVRLKFAIVGGDDRSVKLASLLSRDGHRVHSFALEKAELPGEIPKAGCLQGCVYGADCVVLPVPAERAGLLNAPYAGETLRMDTLLSSLWPGQILICGKLCEDSCLAAVNGGLVVEDLMLRRGFTVGNAAVTAEGALDVMMNASPRTLWRSRVLVTGWGRIAKLLVLRLLALGAEVAVAARKEADRAMAAVFGARPLDFSALEGELGDFDFVVNTVPARVLTDAMLCCIAEDALLLELASPPGGFDMTLAENIGLHALCAPGLPGRYAPLTAAELMRDTIYTVLREQNE